MIKNVYDFQVKYPLFCSDISETWIFSTDFRKILNCQISWKFLPVGAELFYAGGQTDRHDIANSRFSQFCERAQILLKILNKVRIYVKLFFFFLLN